MPTSAATGTKQVQKTGSKTASESTLSSNEGTVGQPLADPSGNGSVQVTAPDGSITSVDASQPGWRDEVAAVDPKHPLAS